MAFHNHKAIVMKHKGNSNNKTYIQEFEFISIKARDSNLSPLFFKETKQSTNRIASFLGISDIQVILLAIICNKNYSQDSVDFDDIANYVNCPPITIATYSSEFESLIKKKMIYREIEKGRFSKRRNILSEVKYAVNPRLVAAITSEKPFDETGSEVSDIYGIIEKASEFINSFRYSEITFEEATQNIDILLQSDEAKSFTEAIKFEEISNSNLLLYLTLCSEYIYGFEKLDAESALNITFGETHYKTTMNTELLNGTNTLIQKNLVLFEESDYRRDRSIKLTEKGVCYFMNNKNHNSQLKSFKSADIVYAKNIPKKELFFPVTVSRQLDFLTDCLKPAKYENLVERMKQHGRKSGLSFLFYGPSGVGKTESVYQIARQTGRDIIKVRISDTKSMWYSESEKLIKGIFENYKSEVLSSSVTPILVFPEADSVFSSRKKRALTSLDKTENAFQDILLDELDDFEGIIFANTNLVGNLDKAFERRFLLKILFEKPQEREQQLIWLDQNAWLKDYEAQYLAECFDFSGGEIANISRKHLMQTILTGLNPSINELLDLCSNEKIKMDVYMDL
jgi:hypothetical protein